SHRLFWAPRSIPLKTHQGAAPWPAAETFEGRGDRKKILKPQDPRQHRANRARGRRKAIRSLVLKNEEVHGPDARRARRRGRRAAELAHGSRHYQLSGPHAGHAATAFGRVPAVSKPQGDEIRHMLAQTGEEALDEKRLSPAGRPLQCCKIRT